MTLPHGCEEKTLQAARSLHELANTVDVPIDVWALAMAQGVNSIEPVKLRGDGRLLTCPRARIEVNAGQSAVRKRFTICHELGHTFFLSRTQSESLNLRVNADVSGLSLEAEERLCNLAAAELLLPEDVFLAQTAQHQPSFHSVRELVELFQVSRLSVLLRILELKPPSWRCAIIRWRPVSVELPFPRFAVEQVNELGGFKQSVFRKGDVCGFDGLCRTVKNSLLSVDHVSSLRIESSGFHFNYQLKNVWSIATESAIDVRRH